MKIVGLFLAVVLMVSLASIALARGAPKQNIAADAIVSVDAVAPNVALRTVPPMTTGYDVICNLTTDAKYRAGNAQHFPAVTDSRRPSSTVDWRSINVNQSAHRLTNRLTMNRQEPRMVLLA